MRHYRLFLLVAVLAASSVACRPQKSSAVEGGGVVTVAAASDVQPAFDEIGGLFERETGRKAVFIFGSSGNLARQIENGAPVDLFAAANAGYVDELAARGLLLRDTRQVYAIGRIVLVTAKGSAVKPRSLADLARPEVKKVAIANPEHAPYGVAARQALESAGVWGDVQRKLVYGENVRQALQYVQTGNAEAGIVALSIANVPEVEHVLIEQSLHLPLEQTMAVVARTKNQRGAREFASLVASPAGQAVMQKYGFIIPGGP